MAGAAPPALARPAHVQDERGQTGTWLLVEAEATLAQMHGFRAHSVLLPGLRDTSVRSRQARDFPRAT